MARRAWGEGSVFFDNTHECWTWRGSYLLGEVKKTKTITAKKKIDLRKKIEIFKASIEAQNFEVEKFSVKEWCLKWLEVFIKPTKKQKTYENYRERLAYVIDEIGDRNINELTSLELQNVFNKMRMDGGKNKKGLAAETVNCARRYLKAALKSAISNKLLSSNPVDGTKPQRKEKREVAALDEEQTLKLLEVCEKGDYIYWGVDNPKYMKKNIGIEYYIRSFYVLITLALATGMRISELRGLNWDNVNFTKEFIQVKGQLVTSVDLGDIFDDPKTYKSNRKIKIDKTTITILKTFRKYQKKYASILGNKYINENNLVFTNTFGKPFNQNNFNRRYFRKMLGMAGISDKFTFHCLRHTHATLLLKNGVNIKVVSERLGHSSVMVTLDIYAHVLDSMEQTAADVWGKITHRNFEEGREKLSNGESVSSGPILSKNDRRT